MLNFNYKLPLLALIGLIFAIFSIINSNQPTPIAPAVVEPASAPYKNFIAGAGIIEAQTRNIQIGTPLPGIIKTINVKVGDKITAGTLLFTIDDRETRATLSIKKADLSKANAELLIAKANLNDARTLNDLAKAVTDRRAISAEEILKRQNTVAIAEARLESAKASIKQAEANLADSLTTLERLTIQAPVNGDVLQVNIRPGEYAQASTLNAPLLVIGNLDKVHVRVDIDENDAWRFDKSRHAVAFLRGNRNFKVELELAYVEPYVIPKRSLTGDSNERVDTRVLQALYRFDRKQLPIYVGQQMDVFIEAEDYPDATNNKNTRVDQVIQTGQHS